MLKRKLNERDFNDLEKIVLADHHDVLDNFNQSLANEEATEDDSSDANEVIPTELPGLDEIDEDEQAKKNELQSAFWSKFASKSSEVEKKEGKIGSKFESHRMAGGRRTAWSDPDDEVKAGEVLAHASKLPKKVSHETNYKDYLESKFYSVYKKPKWADLEVKRANKSKVKKLTSKSSNEAARELSESSEDDEEVALVRQAVSVKGKSKRLPKSFLELKKCTNINQELARPDAYRSIQFHPRTPVAMLATPRSVDLFKIMSNDYSEERHLQEYTFKEPIENVVVTPDGKELIIGSESVVKNTSTIDLVTGRRSTFSVMKGPVKVGLRRLVISPDGKMLACKGEDGLIHLLDTRTKEFAMEFKMNDEVEALCFSADCSHLFSHGRGGRAFIWDVRCRKPYASFDDEGTVIARNIQCSPNGQFLATGSHSGVVNLYSTDHLLKKTSASPVKAFMNLTTEITCVRFNSTSEILAMVSREKSLAIRMAHVASRCIFPNFPHGRVNLALGRLCEVAFSPGSAYCALGGTRGNAYLFRLCHYTNY